MGTDTVGLRAPATKVDSVGKGAAWIGGGRLIGTAVSFVLLMLLTRRSQADVGVFRTLATFLVIAEFLPLFGMHRWLATQMGAEPAQRARHFSSASVWAAATALGLALVYVAISLSGVYDAEISLGLLWIALATVPSGSLLVGQSVLVGIGRSGLVGVFNLAETAGRSVLGVVLVLAGFDVLHIVAMFAAVRWVTGVAIFKAVRAALGPFVWSRAGADLLALRAVIPRMAGALLCFLVLRSAGSLMLPSLTDSAQAGLFAVSYQLADLAMLVPTVVALSSIFTMARGAVTSRSHLRRSMVSMTLLLSLLMFPLAALAVALAEPLLALLFGHRFLAAAPALQLMMLATPLMAIDQVLSQGMVSDGRYHSDLVSVAAGALAAVVVTVLAVPHWGAAAAAAAFVLAMLLSTATRCWLLRDLAVTRVLAIAVWRPALAALLVCAAVGWLQRHLALFGDARWGLLWAVPGAALFFLCFVCVGGGRQRMRRRIVGFVRQRH